jgi:dihydrofolate reductase
MSIVFFDSGISLDGYFAGTNRSPANPMGGVSGKIHQWMFQQKAFWKHLRMEGGEEDGADGKLITDVFARTGAYIMGKRMFEEGAVVWPEDLFEAPVFVLTQENREPWIQKGGTTFYFVNDGIDAALSLARSAAKSKDIRIQGGAHTIQQYLHAGLIDEFTIHIAPVFLGSGVRLFEAIDPELYELQKMEQIPSKYTTHIRYQVHRKQ